MEKRHHLIFVSGSMIANSFIYAMLGRVIYFKMIPKTSEALMWFGLGLQLLFWIVLRLGHRRRSSDQHMEPGHMIAGGLAGAIASTEVMGYLGTGYLFQYLTIMGGHIIAQSLLWNEVTLTGDSKKKQLRLKLYAMLAFLAMNFLTEPLGGTGFERTSIAAVYMVCHIVLLGWLTSGQLIWLAYQEKVAQKAGHVITKEVASIQHTISNRQTSLMSNRLSGLIFLIGVAAAGGILYTLSLLGRIGLSYSKLIQGFVNLLYRVLGPLLGWVFDHLLWIKYAYYEWNSKHLQGGGGPEESIAGGDDAWGGFWKASDYDQTKQAWALLSQLIEIGIALVVIVFAVWLIKRQGRKVVQAVEKRKSGGENLFDMKDWLSDILQAVTPGRKRPDVQADAFRRRYKRFLLQAKHKGLMIEAQDTPTTLAVKLKALRPESSELADVVNAVYNALRYGPEKPETYENGLKALAALQKLLKS